MLTPNQISNLQLWLDAQTLTLSDQQGVASWLDASPNNAPVVQANPALQPRFDAAGINGYPAVKFAPSATAECLGNTSPSANLIPTSGQYTAFVVAMNQGTSVYAGASDVSDYPYPFVVACGQSSSTTFPGWGFTGTYGSPQTYSMGAIAFRSGGTPVSAPPNVMGNWNGLMLLEQSYNGATLSGWANGVVSGTDTWTMSFPSSGEQLWLGSFNGNQETAFYGWIGEVIFYNRVLSPTEREQIEAYLQAKWDLPFAQPPVTAPITASYNVVTHYYGDPQVPHSIKRQRAANLETMRRLGTPVLIKKMYTDEDVEKGIAIESPTRDTIMGQSTHATDELSHGVGYVSVETQQGEWYDPATGDLYISDLPPDATYLVAPRYRGYGPGFLTYAILPDRPEDQWKLTPQGALIRQQTAMAQLPWWPQVGDNDILVTVRLGPDGRVAETYEVYQLRAVSPVTMRGMDRRGNREFEANAGGNRYWIGQQCEMNKVPTNDILYTIETDR